MSVKTWAEQIADLEATKKSLTETMQTVAKAASEEGRTMNTAEASQFDDAEAQIKQIDADLARVKKLAELEMRLLRDKMMQSIPKPCQGFFSCIQALPERQILH